MNGTPKIERQGIVVKVIKSVIPTDEESAEIQLEGAEPLYREIRVPNSFEDEDGNKIRLAQGARVKVTIELEFDEVVGAVEARARAASSS